MTRDETVPMTPLEAAIDDLPASVRASLAAAYEIAASLDQRRWSDAVRTFVREVTANGGNFDADNLSKSLQIPQRDARKIASGLSATVALLTDTEGTVREFLSAATRRAGLLPSANGAAEIAADIVLSEKGTLEAVLSRRRLAASVLPSLDYLEIAVDLRFKFDGNQLNDAVPVAIIRVDTDTFNQQLWVQLDLDDVNNAIKKLNDAKEQMEKIGEIYMSDIRKVKNRV